MMNRSEVSPIWIAEKFWGVKMTQRMEGMAEAGHE